MEYADSDQRRAHDLLTIGPEELRLREQYREAKKDGDLFEAEAIHRRLKVLQDDRDAPFSRSASGSDS